MHLLLPEVISFVKSGPYAYIAGFKNPKVLFPALLRAELTSETIPATTGADADVPLATYC